MEKRALHGLLLTLSTVTVQALCPETLDAAILSAGDVLWAVGMCGHNLTKVSDLQIRLVRASELTTPPEGNGTGGGGFGA